MWGAEGVDRHHRVFHVRLALFAYTRIVSTQLENEFTEKPHRRATKKKKDEPCWRQYGNSDAAIHELDRKSVV